MDRTQSAPFALSSSRLVVLLAPAVVLAAFAGCSHKRSSMRPVYGGSVVGSRVVSPANPVPGGIITTEPEGGEPILTPVPSEAPSTSRSDDVIRASGSPPVAPEAEPQLEEVKPTGRANPANSGGIELNRPSALKSTGRSARASTRAPRISLKQAVSPFFAEPDDLFQPPKADRPWKYIVVHHSANASGGLDQIDRDHRKVLGFEGCGYHFVIGNGSESPDGQVEVAQRWSSQRNGVHCKNGKNPDVNEYGIGICLVGNFDLSEPTPKQVEAARALVAYLADRYKIAPDHAGAHEEFADGPTACPGKNFPAQAIFGSKHVAAR